MTRPPRWAGRNIEQRWLTSILCCLALLPSLAACSTITTSTATVASPTSGTRPPSPITTLPPTPPTATAASARATVTSAPPGATATRSAAATASRPVANATPGGTPTGPIPAGWRTYRGTLPFTIAVPPDWVIDDQSAQGVVYFYAPTPEQTTFLVLATTGQAEANPNLDVLRDRWFRSRIRSCGRFAIERTSQVRYAGIDFATVGATCDLASGLAFSYTGIGLRQQVPWIFEFNAPYGTYDRALTATFEPMIQSWTFDEQPGR